MYQAEQNEPAILAIYRTGLGLHFSLVSIQFKRAHFFLDIDRKSQLATMLRTT